MRLDDILSMRTLHVNKIKKIETDKFILESEFEQNMEKLDCKIREVSMDIDKLNRILVNGVTFAPNKMAYIIAYMLLKFEGDRWERMVRKHDAYDSLSNVYHLYLTNGRYELPISNTPILIDCETELDYRSLTFHFFWQDLKIPVEYNEYYKYNSRDININFDYFNYCWPIRACIDELARKQIENNGKELSYDEMVVCVNEYIINNTYITDYIKKRRKISF